MRRRKRSGITNSATVKRQRQPAYPEPNKAFLARSLEWLLPEDSIFSKMWLHGNTKGLPKSLRGLAMFWAWSESRNLTDAYLEAFRFFRSVFDSSVPTSYQGFMGALTR